MRALVQVVCFRSRLDRYLPICIGSLCNRSATPTPLNASLMCTMSGTGERALGALMIVQHLALLPLLTFWTGVFIWFIGQA